MSLLKDKIEISIEEAELQTKNKFTSLPKAARWAIIAAVIGAVPVYFSARALSARYWQEKYKQYLVAATPSFENPAPPAISEGTILPLPDNAYAAFTLVTNENIDLSLDLTPYRFDFYNQKGELVYSAADKLYLLPNQKKYVIVAKINSPDKITKAQLTFTQDLAWKKRLDLPQVKIVPSQPVQYRQHDPMAFVAEGSILNNSPYDIKQVRLTFIVTDAQGSVKAVSQRDEFSIKPNERRGYKQLWPGLSLEDDVSVSVFADTNLLDNANLVLPRQPSSPSSDLDRPKTDPF